MRDHTKLRAFQLAISFAFAGLQAHGHVSSRRTVGLTSQVRRAAVSVPSNIVEGYARPTQSDYLKFLDIAYGSASEAKYQFVPSRFDWGFLNQSRNEALATCADELTPYCRGSFGPFALPEVFSLKPLAFSQSVQRESTSQFLLGKVMGYHYTMDAFCWLNQIVKDQEHE